MPSIDWLSLGIGVAIGLVLHQLLSNEKSPVSIDAYTKFGIS